MSVGAVNTNDMNRVDARWLQRAASDLVRLAPAMGVMAATSMPPAIAAQQLLVGASLRDRNRETGVLKGAQTVADEFINRSGPHRAGASVTGAPMRTVAPTQAVETVMAEESQPVAPADGRAFTMLRDTLAAGVVASALSGIAWGVFAPDAGLLPRVIFVAMVCLMIGIASLRKSAAS